ncbi:MAG: DUF3422 domain-containing protein [Amphritea sp.]
MKSHPQRQQIADEVHARPFQHLSSPLKVMHFAVMKAEHDAAEIRQSISALFVACGGVAVGDKADFCIQEMDDLSLRWEAHNEFYTLTFYYRGTEQDWQQSMPGLPQDWSEGVLGELITGVQLLVKSPAGDADGRVPPSVFDADFPVIGSHVMREAATVWADFHAQGEFGLDRILVQDNRLHGYQCGRLIQRLCEIDTYRAVALLGLAPARQTMKQVSRLDTELAVITNHLSNLEKGEDSAALDDLMNLAAQAEEISAETANRFSASDAYYAVVRMRISELEETRVEGLQTMEQFIDRRVDPAMRTWRAAAARLERLSERIARASNLLRSNIDLSTEQQVHGLLSSMNKRTRRQLTLQAKLETFSIIVVTYYVFDLVERTIRHLTSGEPEELAISGLSYSLPLIVLIVWWYVRKVTKEFKSDD